MDKKKIATAGSIFAAFVASLCCVGPIAVALIGLGSAGLFVAIGEYRPYIMFATLIFLGVAFFFTYRKREVACEDGTCKVQRPSRWNQIILWVSTIAVALLLVAPYLDFSLTASPNQLRGLRESGQAGMATTTIDVGGMTCPACARGIEISLSKLNGVKKARVDFDRRQAIVRHDEQKVKEDQLIDAVKDFGYDASLSSRNQQQSR